MWTTTPVCSDMQMDLKVTEILVMLVQLLQNVHLYFFVKYSRYYARLHLNERVLKIAKLSTFAPLIMMLINMICTFIFCC